MKTNQIMYPVWKTSVIIPAINFSYSPVEYKYIVVTKNNQNNEEIVRWETLEHPTMNRQIWLERKPMTLRIYDEEGKYQHA